MNDSQLIENRIRDFVSAADDSDWQDVSQPGKGERACASRRK
jgi:hypothetical protein